MLGVGAYGAFFAYPRVPCRGEKVDDAFLRDTTTGVKVFTEVRPRNQEVAIADEIQTGLIENGQFDLNTQIMKHFSLPLGVCDTQFTKDQIDELNRLYPHEWIGDAPTTETFYLIRYALAKHDLSAYLSDEHLSSPPSMEQGHSWIKDICVGLFMLHRSGFTHMDLKPPNILISKESPFVAKLADFGISEKLNSVDPNKYYYDNCMYPYYSKLMSLLTRVPPDLERKLWHQWMAIRREPDSQADFAFQNFQLGAPDGTMDVNYSFDMFIIFMVESQLLLDNTVLVRYGPREVNLESHFFKLRNHPKIPERQDYRDGLLQDIIRTFGLIPNSIFTAAAAPATTAPVDISLMPIFHSLSRETKTKMIAAMQEELCAVPSTNNFDFFIAEITFLIETMFANFRDDLADPSLGHTESETFNAYTHLGALLNIYVKERSDLYAFAITSAELLLGNTMIPYKTSARGTNSIHWYYCFLNYVIAPLSFFLVVDKDHLRQWFTITRRCLNEGNKACPTLMEMLYPDIVNHHPTLTPSSPSGHASPSSSSSMSLASSTSRSTSPFARLTSPSPMALSSPSPMSIASSSSKSSVFSHLSSPLRSQKATTTPADTTAVNHVFRKSNTYQQGIIKNEIEGFCKHTTPGTTTNPRCHRHTHPASI